MIEGFNNRLAKYLSRCLKELGNHSVSTKYQREGKVIEQ
ncbi:hypothetical protein pah_c016o024 [Parachlamydia acanthamoebae str. Hall's coccus]|nr:hypothetical protein pah_c016o024 [Parachlamydia acanthamoebae str. Hall's coccus]